MRISRRTVLAGVPLLGCANDAAARASRLHIAPDGAGDGTSWDAAAPLRAIDDLIRGVQPGGEILIAADRGEYDSGPGLDISSGGIAEGPVRVRGVDSVTGAPRQAVVRGIRSESDVGAEAFRLRRGADHLHFSHLDFRAIGNGCFRVGAPLTNLTIEDCVCDDVYRFLENGASGNQGQASLRNFALRRCRGTRVERGFTRIRYASRGGVIEDCAARGLANEGGHIPVGCALEGRAGDITYRRCVMEGFQQWRVGAYWNGDGFSDEGGNYDIRYEHCEGRGSTDGGFDCKSSDVVLENCVAEDNKRNFRIWSARATLTGCVSRNPNFRGRDVERADACHIWIGGERARIRIADLTIEDGDATPILEFDHDGSRVEIRGAAIRSPRENWDGVAMRAEGGVIIAAQD